MFYEDIKQSSKNNKRWHREVLFSFSRSEAFIVEEGLRPHTVLLPRHTACMCRLTRPEMGFDLSPWSRNLI